MRTDTRGKILEYIRQRQQLRAHDLIRELGLSAVAIHKQLNNLVKSGQVRKIGKPPRVYYLLNEMGGKTEILLDNDLKRFIDDRYLYISPRGEVLKGESGFIAWARATNQEKETERLALRYKTVRLQADKFFRLKDWLDITGKIKTTFGRVFVDKLLCLDWYSLPEFGKTKLGQLVLHAKQSQSRELIQQIALETKDQIQKIIKIYKIKAVVFIPHTIPRKLQFLKEYAFDLNLKMPETSLIKVYSGGLAVAQKSLSKLNERVINARETILINAGKAQKKYSTVLLIDDAVGSGATQNETAKKLKENKLARKVVGFSIVGSFKGFDVIREV